MKYSQYFLRTEKELPAQEDSKNAELLIRGGFIRKEMAGVYSYMPLGLRVIKKISDIIREEMDAAGCIEMLMPGMSPKEPWEKTKRWNTVDVLYKMEMANGKECALNPTHEEVVTPLVQNWVRSHKDLPLAVYQIQTKYRNEARAKSGILRGREFIMKDAYSFHTTEEDFEAFYEKMTEVYIKIYDQLGLGAQTHVVSASGGAFSAVSHEFQTVTPVGEDTLFYDEKSDIYYNQEIAPATAKPWSNIDEAELPREDVEGKGIIGVGELCKFLNIPIEKTTKTMLFVTDKKKVIAAAVRGGYNVNVDKLRMAAGCGHIELAHEELVRKITGAEVGYAGILNLPESVEVFMDESMKGRKNFEMGANKTDYHSININFGRDLPEPDNWYDIKEVKEGDSNPETGTVYTTSRAIEVGNIFPLKTKFSDSFKFNVIGEDGKPAPVIMGCYGIGISRVLGTLVEVFHDEKGIIWPENIAPFQVYLAAVGKGDEAYATSETIYNQLTKAGMEVFYDDRKDKKIGPGQKFGDADLLGMPYRVVVSERNMEDGIAEVTCRKTGAVEMVPFDQVQNYLETKLF